MRKYHAKRVLKSKFKIIIIDKYNDKCSVQHSVINDNRTSSVWGKRQWFL